MKIRGFASTIRNFSKFVKLNEKIGQHTSKSRPIKCTLLSVHILLYEYLYEDEQEERMPTIETIVKYTREEVYSRKEVIEILSVGSDVISRAISAGILRPVKVVDAKGKFFMKYEIETLRNSKVGIVSSKARQLVEKVRAEKRIDTLPRSTLSQSLIDEESQYGEPVQKYVVRNSVPEQESEKMTAFRMLRESLMQAFMDAFGSHSETASRR
jgi:hypothetical protein